MVYENQYRAKLRDSDTAVEQINSNSICCDQPGWIAPGELWIAVGAHRNVVHGIDDCKGELQGMGDPLLKLSLVSCIAYFLSYFLSARRQRNTLPPS